jgi:hypothetical protein
MGCLQFLVKMNELQGRLSVKVLRSPQFLMVGVNSMGEKMHRTSEWQCPGR